MTSTNGSNGNGYSVPKPREDWLSRRKQQNSDGNFSASGRATISTVPGTIRVLHDYNGSVQGRAAGNAVSGIEQLNFVNGCNGLSLELGFSGSR